MANPHSKQDLLELGARLQKSGPVKTLATPRRVRILFNGTYVADTTAALFVWEHAYYPYYYVPQASFAPGVLRPLPAADSGNANDDDPPRGFRTAELRVGSRATDRVLVFGAAAAAAALRGLARVEFAAADAWFEEDARIRAHPKDPFRRVDVLHSARAVEVRVLGRLVARASAAFHLYETGLPCRFYLPPTAVVGGVVELVESATTTECPYKGVANYYHVEVDEDGEEEEDGGKTKKRRFEDLVWYYRTPALECAPIAGCLCFYHEKQGVEVRIDGQVVARPETPWS